MHTMLAFIAVATAQSSAGAHLVIIWPSQTPVVVAYPSLARCEVGAADFNEIIRRKGDSNPQPPGSVRVGAPAWAFCIRG